LIRRKFPLLICRNRFPRLGAYNPFVSFDPAPKPELNGLGQRRASLGMVVCMFIVLAGVIAVVGVLIAYGLMGTL
jgi:hypothetical protein